MNQKAPTPTSEFHVMTLTPNQQAALRYCALNWAQQKILVALTALKNTPTGDVFELASEHIMKTLLMYDDVAGSWPLANGIKDARGEITLFYFDDEHFNIIKQSINMYKKDNAAFVLGADRMAQVDAQIKAVTQLVYESSKYKYTLKEIAAKSKA